MILQQTTKTATYSLFSLIFTVIIGFGVMFFSPEEAYAADTTYYVPMQGYYLGQNGLPIGMNWVCSNGSCTPSAAYDSANRLGVNTGMTNPSYANCTSEYCKYYGSNYPYKSYVPNIKTNAVYADGTVGPANKQYEYVSYPYQTYTPYVKNANGKYDLGTAKNIPYYSFNPDGTLANGGGLATYSAGKNGFIPTVNTSGTSNGANGGFIMTGN